MKKSDFAFRLAAEDGRSPAEAADRLDDVVHAILKKLKSGKRAALPGLGKFVPGKSTSFQFTRRRP
jgi:nucleoid DNA-binding protein